MKLLFIPRGRYKQDASIFPKNKLSKKKNKKKKKKKNILFIPRETKTLSHLHSPLTTPYTVHLKVKRGTKGL